MTRLRRQVRQTLTIARRDFVATVFTPVFLLFLFAPVIMASFGAIGGMGAASVSQGAGEKARLVLLLRGADVQAVRAADARLRPLFTGEQRPPALDIRAPGDDTAAQARAALTAGDRDVVAVLRGPLDSPAIVYIDGNRNDARYLSVLATQAWLAQHARGTSPAPARLDRVVSDAPTLGGRTTASFVAVFGIFFLTLFLSGQVVSTMAEERNNKVIEILAAAVPLESVFLGKLLGMYGVALLFIAFWATVLSQAGMLLPGDLTGGLTQLHPAIGMPGFALLFGCYFTTAFLLLGSVFLGVGAQAATMREVQMLSLPITIVQVAMFGLASAAIAHPGEWLATFAELFPLSSPFAMAGRAAASSTWWPHLAALAWQLLWVAIFISTGARLFRRGVLQSGSAKPAWRRLFNRG